jgi:hypothetical protein
MIDRQRQGTTVGSDGGALSSEMVSVVIRRATETGEPQAEATPSGQVGKNAALRELVDVLREQLDGRTREVSEAHVLLWRTQSMLPSDCRAVP